MRDVIATGQAPQAIGPYSQAIRAAGLIFTSGQIAIDPRLRSRCGRCERADGAGTEGPFRGAGGFGQRDGEGFALHRVPEEHG